MAKYGRYMSSGYFLGGRCRCRWSMSTVTICTKGVLECYTIMLCSAATAGEHSGAAVLVFPGEITRHSRQPTKEFASISWAPVFLLGSSTWLPREG